ncbi:anti-sigma factor [Fodinicola feengrottensis]|uniref:anti-sigma factor n=1 Tax=Fodinicola feengrottensis TaxID=435914 RepID=UPI0013D57012|nr:anti-sigma factor [Fodinicola feengrottensis]
MSELDLTDARSHQRFEELAAGWALHGLDVSDEQLFQPHLDSCEGCQRTVDELVDTLGDLAFELPSDEPPATLGDRIRAAAAHYEAGSVRPLILSVSRKDRSRRPTVRSVPWMVTAAAAVIVVALGGWNVVLRGSQTSDSHATVQQQHLIHQLLAPGSQSTALSTSDGHRVAYVVTSGADLEVVTDGVAANDSARTRYWLWGVWGANTAPRPLGSFSVSGRCGAPPCRSVGGWQAGGQGDRFRRES